MRANIPKGGPLSKPTLFESEEGEIGMLRKVKKGLCLLLVLCMMLMFLTLEVLAEEGEEIVPQSDVVELQSEGQPFLTVAPPFESGGTQWSTARTVNSVRMSGLAFGQSLEFFFVNGASSGLFQAWSRHNLQGQFTTLTGYIGRIDGSVALDATIRFVADGDIELASFEIFADALPRRISVDVTDVHSLRITASVNLGWFQQPNFAFADPVIEGVAPSPQPTVTIVAIASPTTGGSVSGGGTFNQGSWVTLEAWPNTGWRFAGWYENGWQRVSSNATHSFSATHNATFEARFTQETQPGQRIQDIFPDSGLAQAVARNLGVSVSSAVTQDDLDNIFALEAHNRNIQSIHGLQSLTSLTWLDLRNNQISILQPLAGLSNVETLALGGNQIYNIQPLSGLSSLTWLDLGAQDIERASVSWASPLVVPNQLRNLNGNSFAPSVIGDSGVYNGGQLMWHNPPTGALWYQWEQTIRIGGATATFSGVATLPVTGGPAGLPFRDVNTWDWFYAAVRHVYQNGIMIGTSSTTFSPHASLTRAEVTAIIFRLENGAGANPPSATPIFVDVRPGTGTYWARGYIYWAHSNGIVQGFPNGNFAPGESLSKEQLAAMMHRLAVSQGYNVSVPAHVNAPANTSNWAREYMRWAAHNGFLRPGIPSSAASRAETAFFLHQFDIHYVR